MCVCVCVCVVQVNAALGTTWHDSKKSFLSVHWFLEYARATALLCAPAFDVCCSAVRYFLVCCCSWFRGKERKRTPGLACIATARHATATCANRYAVDAKGENCKEDGRQKTQIKLQITFGNSTRNPLPITLEFIQGKTKFLKSLEWHNLCDARRWTHAVHVVYVVDSISGSFMQK